MAFQMLNLSIGCIEFQPLGTHLYADFNDLNSFTEYFSEVMLGHTNEYPEFTGHTTHNSHWQKHMGIKPFIPINAEILAVPVKEKPVLNVPASVGAYDEYLNVINPPPPKDNC